MLSGLSGLNPFSRPRFAGGGGGGTSIDTAKILRWWEDGVTADKANSVDLVSVPTTSSETVGPWSTIWDLNLNRNETALTAPASWAAYTVAAVVQLQGRDARNFYAATSQYDQISTVYVAGSPGPANAGYLVKADNGSAVSVSPDGTGWESIVFVKKATTSEFWVNGVKTNVTNGASAPSSFYRVWDTASYHVACFAFMDESWGSSEISDFHNSGSFVAYADL